MKESEISRLPEKVNCVNCGSELNGQFCSSCGQPNGVERINFTSLSNELKEKILGLDGRFMRTLKLAFTNPGRMSMDVVNGNRRRYIGPAGFFIIALTLYALSLQLFGWNLGDITKIGMAWSGNEPAVDDPENITNKVGELFGRLFKVISFFSVILLGLLLWLFNRRMKLNVFEHLVFAFYSEAIVYFISLIQVPFLNSDASLIMGGIISVLSFLYFIYAYATYDTKRSTIRRILKAIALRIVLNLLVVLMVAIVVVAYFIVEKMST